MSKRLNSILKLALSFMLVLSMLCCVLTFTNAKASDDATKIIMHDGASIRYESPTGIRFTAYVANSEFTDTETHTLKDGVTVGMYLIPSSLAGGATEIDGSTTGVATVTSSDASFKWAAFDDKDGYQKFDVAIYNIPTTSYNESVLAAAFYNETVTETISRSVAAAATASLAENELLDDADKLDETQISKLAEYAPKAASFGEVEFESTSDSTRKATWEAVDGATFYEVEFLDGYFTTTTDTTLSAARDFKSVKAYGLSNLSAKIFNKVVTWNAVDGAVGYLVKTADGIVKTTETSIALTTETSVSVVAYGNESYSNVETREIHALSETQIATFDSADYINELSPLSYDPATIVAATNPATEFSTGIGFNPTPKWNETVDDKTGVIDVALKMSNYPGGGCRAGTLTIELQNGLNLTDNGGIKVSLYLRGTSGVGDNYVYIAGKTKTQGYTSAYGANGLSALNVEIGVWTDWYIPSTDLVKYYADGDGKITIMTYSVNGYGQFDGRTELYIDDISYYNQLATPTNLAVANNTVTWDAVAGAESYVVNIDGTDVDTVTETSYDISSYATTGCAIKVKATSTAAPASEYSKVYAHIITSGLDVATFDSALYENSVKVLLDNTVQPWNGGAIDYTKISPNVEYQTGVDGANGGDALFIQPIFCSYVGGGARHAAFTVKLARPLDLSGTYTGITVRFKALDIAHGLNGGASDTDTIDIIQLANPTVKDNTYKVYKDSASSNVDYSAYSYPYLEITEGSWVEWTLSVEQLKTLYSDGATELVFVLVSKAGTSYNYAHPANTYLDYIKYNAG